MEYQKRAQAREKQSFKRIAPFILAVLIASLFLAYMALRALAANSISDGVIISMLAILVGVGLLLIATGKSIKLEIAIISLTTFSLIFSIDIDPTGWFRLLFMAPLLLIVIVGRVL